MKKIHIFLASSNDMMKFRTCTEKVIDELNQSLAQHFNVQLEVFRWEKNTIPQMGRPQQIIFEQSNFEKIDIFVGILGERFGTPTGAVDENEIEYESGTQEEYDAAYQLYKRYGRPSIMIFKSNAPLKQGNFDVEQYAKVQQFIKEFDTGKKHPGIYSQFKTLNEFQSKLRIALIKKILNLIDEQKKESYVMESHLSHAYQKLGYLQMFVSETNNLRGASKNSAIIKSKHIELMAKTGNSFLGSIGNRYLDILIQNIQENNSKIRIMLLNPWSVSAIHTAFCESASEQEYLDCLLHKKPAQDILSSYMQSSWYQMKLRDVLTNYGDICKQYPNIELRFVDVEFPASVLLTDEYCYYEPYANYCKVERLRKKTSTFEVKMSSETSLYQASKQYFDILWPEAISYDTFIKNEQIYKMALTNKLDAEYKKHIEYYIGVHAWIRKDNKILLLHRSDLKAYMPGKWDIPGGTLETGETPIDTVIREVKEETGIDIQINNIRYIYTNKVELPFRQTIQLIYDAEYIYGDIVINPLEHQNYKWVSIEEIEKHELINFLVEMLESEY